MAAMAHPVSVAGVAGKRPVLIALAALVVASIAVAVVFAWPRGTVERTRFDLGPADKYAIGSVTQVPKGEFWLVRVGKNEFLALSWRDSHSGCSIPWRPTFAWPDASGTITTGWFRDPCHGSTYDREGHRVWGPTSRDMDRYLAGVVGGTTFVNTGYYMCGYSASDARCALGSPNPLLDNPAIR